MRTPLFITIDGLTINTMYIEAYKYSDIRGETTIYYSNGKKYVLDGNYSDHLNQALNTVVIYKNNA